jgi:hypothetical protein
MCCGPYVGTITCVKGIDTISRELDPGNLEQNINLSDTLSYYRNLVYVCSASPEFGPYTIGGYTCGSAINQEEKIKGYGCVEITETDGPCGY